MSAAYNAFTSSGNAEMTNRFIAGDENFKNPEWRENGAIEGVPVSVFYRTEIPEMEEGEEFDWIDNVNWEESVYRIEIDLVQCDIEDIEQSKIDLIKAKYGI